MSGGRVQQRKVGNMLALAILSAVVQRPMHPYEIASTLRGTGKDADMDIKWGSLYTVVRNTTKHGLIEPVENIREGRRPERTVYRITGEGRAELVDWARELVAHPVTERTRFRAGLSVLGALHPAEATSLLRDRLTRIREGIAARRSALREHLVSVPRLFLIEEEFDLAVQEAEAAWIDGLLAELESGSYPGLDRWRAYHEGGAGH